MRTILQIVFYFLLMVECFSQVPPAIIKSTNESNSGSSSGVNVQNVASNRIDFKPGYNFSAANSFGVNGIMDAYIGEGGVYNLPTDYFGSGQNFEFDRTLNTSLVVGSIVGSQNVSPIGGWQYSIPIKLPPGINGTVPSIALNYSSQSGDGFMGYGWNLSGISSIHRIPYTHYQNNEVRQIQLDNTDDLALDGNILEYIGSGTNGVHTNGAKYKTFSETFSEITAHDSNGEGPDYFSVIEKDGTTLIYGQSFNSRVFTSEDSDNFLSWRLENVTDLHGNYVQYIYDFVDQNNVFSPTLLTKILYTGNSTIGTTPFCEIKFLYKEREDKSKSYLDGGYIDNTMLLEWIEVYSEGELVRKYELKYGYNLHSLLYEIIEYGSDGSEFNSSRFQYGEGENDWESEANVINQSGILNETAEYRTGDYNGDGLTDISAFVYSTPNNVKTYTDWVLYTNTGNGFDRSIVTTGLPANFFPFDPEEPFTQMSERNMGIESFDMNGDGVDDILLGEILGTFYKYTAYFSNGDGTFTPSPQLIQVQFDHEMAVGDFDGDRMLDLLVYNRFPQNNSYIWQVFFFDEGTNDLTSTFTPYQGATISPQPESGFYPIDYDGDGTTEILTTRGLDHCIFDIIVTRNFSGNFNYDQKRIQVKEIKQSNFPSIEYLKLIGDFNGDGNTDILTNTLSTANNWFLGTGTSDLGTATFNNSYEVVSANSLGLSNPLVLNGNTLELNDASRRFILDINGDAKADIIQLIYDPNSEAQGLPALSIASIYLSEGNNFKTYSVELPYYFYEESAFNFGDFNADGSADLLHAYNGNVWIHSLYQSPKNYLMTAILDGFNNRTEISYQSISQANQNVYEKGSSAIYPLVDIQVPLYVVSETSTEDGIGGRNITNYEYKGAKVHKMGKGFLGFTEISAINHNNLTKVVQTFETDNDFYDTRVSNTKIYNTVSGQLISQNESEYEKIALTNPSSFPSPLLPSPKRYFIFLKSESSINNITGVTSETTYDYDTDGNLIHSNISFGGGIETVDVNYQYGQFGGVFPDKLISIVTNKQRVGTPIYTREQQMDYNLQGDLIEMISDPTSNQSITINYGHNDFGGVTSKIISASGLPSSTVNFVYDNNNRYVVLYTNTLGNTSLTERDGKWGLPTKIISIDGLETTYEYDGFGRMIKTTDPNGVVTETEWNWLANEVQTTSGNPLEADDVMFEVVNFTTGAPTVRKEYNSAGSERKIANQGLNDDIISITSYNNEGKIKSTSAQFYQGDINVDITEFIYDDLSRIVSSQNGAGITLQSYSTLPTGYKITSIAPDGNSSSTITDKSGKVTEVEDAGGVLEFTYNSQGSRSEIKLNGIVVGLMQYDNLGRQIQLTEPNSGITQYSYDAFGRTTTQIDANGNQIDFGYDAAGRVIEKITPEGSFNYSYVSSGNGLEQVESILAPNGFDVSYVYDNFGRISSATEVINGQSFTAELSYDQNSNLLSKTYPSGFKLNYEYDSKGYLIKIKDDNGTVLWEGEEQNALGTWTKYNKGNGITTEIEQDNLGLITGIKSGSVQDISITYDVTSGNLLSRSDNTKTLSETFEYDNQNRLTKITFNGNDFNIAYADNGNITQKFDAGSYTYDNAKVNAVTEVDNVNEEIPLIVQDIDYTSFHSPSSIEEGDYFMGIEYGVDNQRRVSTLNFQNQLQNTRFYLGDMERNTDAAGSITDVHYISGGSGLVAIAVEDANGMNYYYPYHDHIGSVTVVTDDAGNIIYEQNFDAWGKRRNPQDWSYLNIPASPNWLYRGFTFHEHLPEFGLINMNGRMYDPILGRMLSPDNYVQSPFSSQNYNRYSYAMNNPLKFVDPNGEIVWLPIIIGAAVSAYMGGRIANPGLNNPRDWNWFDEGAGKTWGYVIGGALVGGASGWVGGTVASSGLPFSKTVSSVFSSFTYSLGTSLYTGGQTSVSINFGFGSYNLSNREFNSIFNWKNLDLASKISYTFGTLANIQDGFAGRNGTSVEAKARKGTIIGHHAVEGKYNGDDITISVGAFDNTLPGSNVTDLEWEMYYVKRTFQFNTADGRNGIGTSDLEIITTIDNINGKMLSNMTERLNNGRNLLNTGRLKYGYGFGCVNYTSRALMYSGVITLNGVLSFFPGITSPVFLNAELFMRQAAIWASPYLIND